MRVNRENQTLLKSLGSVADARIRAGSGSAGDVLRASLERSTLEQELLELDRQRTAATAELNRLLNRPAAAPLPTPDRDSLSLLEPLWDLDALSELAVHHQPEVQAARLRYEATVAGVEIARLLDVPDLTVGATYTFIGDDRPPSSVVDVGRDALAFGVSVTLPIYQGKYTAARAEAAARSRGAAVQIDDVSRRYEATLADLLAQARAARKTMALYSGTVLPLARQTYRNDLEAYTQPDPRVDFDRLVADYRNLLQAEVQYYRSVTDLAIAETRIEQLVAVPLAMVPAPPSPIGSEREDTANDDTVPAKPD